MSAHRKFLKSFLPSLRWLSGCGLTGGVAEIWLPRTGPTTVNCEVLVDFLELSPVLASPRVNAVRAVQDDDVLVVIASQHAAAMVQEAPYRI